MNKKVVLIVVFLLILVTGITGAMMMKKSVLPLPNTTTPVATQAESGQPQAESGSLKDLLTGGKAQKCTYTDNTQETAVSTTIYVANGKMRGDINTNSSEINIKSHMIVDSTYTYFWSENSNQGFKILIDAQPSVAPSQKSQSVNLDQKLNYTCENWNKIDSYFELPANITFQVLAVPTVANQCAVCDNLPGGEAQDACKTQLNCK